MGEDMSKEEFRRFCRECWEKRHCFAVIDVTSKKEGESIELGLIFLYPNNKWKLIF